MLILRLQSPEDTQFAYTHLADSVVSSEWQYGDWERVSELAAGQPITLLIPTQDVLLTHTVLITQNSRQLKQALPFALEESLAGDVEEQHFVAQSAGEQGELDVAVIERERLIAWMNALKQHKMRARYILPDIFALPCEDDGFPTVWIRDGQAWVRDGVRSGFSCAAEVVPLLVEDLFADVDNAAHDEGVRPTIHLDADQETAWPANMEILPSSQPEKLLQKSMQAGIGLNLLNGYQDKSMSTFNRHWKRWRAAAALAALTLAILLGLQGVETFKLQQEVAAAEQRNVALFQSIFPEVKNISVTSLRGRTNSELQLLQQEKGRSGTKTSPLPYMSLVAETFQKEAAVDITNITVRNGKLAIRFESDNLQLPSKLEKQLSEKLGYEVQMEAGTDNEGRWAELILEVDS